MKHRAALHALRVRAIIAPLIVSVEGVASHAVDDPVLSTALSGHADYLVTGDADLRRLGRIDSVSIVTPREFLDILDQPAPSPKSNV
ncbi:MAG: hypothetical protein IT305_02330 [Chloroflexi bacterium]|nr:hypothetical protein [Chloroflexota bacterium]